MYYLHVCICPVAIEARIPVLKLSQDPFGDGMTFSQGHLRHQKTQIFML